VSKLAAATYALQQLRLDVAKYTSTLTLAFPASAIQVRCSFYVDVIMHIFALVQVTSVYDPDGVEATHTLAATDPVNGVLSTQPGGQIGQANTNGRLLKGRRGQAAGAGGTGTSAIVTVTVFIPPSNIDPSEDASTQLDAYLLVSSLECPTACTSLSACPALQTAYNTYKSIQQADVNKALGFFIQDAAVEAGGAVNVTIASVTKTQAAVPVTVSAATSTGLAAGKWQASSCHVNLHFINGLCRSWRGGRGHHCAAHRRCRDVGGGTTATCTRGACVVLCACAWVGWPIRLALPSIPI
jgi:hypothetical protein